MANLQEGTSSVMNSYRMKAERIIKDKRLTNTGRKSKEVTSIKNFWRKLSNILCLVLKLKALTHRMRCEFMTILLQIRIALG